MSKNITKKYYVIEYKLIAHLPKDIINIIYWYSVNNTILDNKSIETLIPNITITNKKQVTWYKNDWFSFTNEKMLRIYNIINGIPVVKHDEICKNILNKYTNIIIRYVDCENILFSTNNKLILYNDNNVIEFDSELVDRYRTIYDFKYVKSNKCYIVLINAFGGGDTIIIRDLAKEYTIKCGTCMFYKNDYIMYVSKSNLYVLDILNINGEAKCILDKLPRSMQYISHEENTIFMHNAMFVGGGIGECFVGSIICDNNFTFSKPIHIKNNKMPREYFDSGINKLITAYSTYDALSNRSAVAPASYHNRYMYISNYDELYIIVDAINGKHIYDRFQNKHLKYPYTCSNDYDNYCVSSLTWRYAIQIKNNIVYLIH